jgi:hypothetical protein
VKQLGWILLGLVVGFLIGGVQPRAELAVERDQSARLQDDLVKAQSKAARCSGGGAALLPGIGALLPDRPPPAPDRSPSVDDDDDGGHEPDGADGADVIVVGDEGGDGPAFEDQDAAFDAAVEAQQIRAEQSRAALAEQADLDDGELEEVDQIVGEMNDRLSEYADELLVLAESGEDPSPRELLGLTHDVTGILYDSQSALEDTVGSDRMPDVDPEASAVWNYLDLGIMREAAERAQGGG